MTREWTQIAVLTINSRGKDMYVRTLAVFTALPVVAKGVCWCWCQACQRVRLETNNKEEATTMEPPTPTLLLGDPGGVGSDDNDGRCGTWPCVGVLASILLIPIPAVLQLVFAAGDASPVQPTPKS